MAQKQCPACIAREGVHGFWHLQAMAQNDQKNKIIVDLIVKLLGLDVCVDTIVGDQLLRGISGGQKKRVTSGGQA